MMSGIELPHVTGFNDGCDCCANEWLNCELPGDHEGPCRARTTVWGEQLDIHELVFTWEVREKGGV